MTISEKIKQALHTYSNANTKDWIVESMIENIIGVSFVLDTPKFAGEITLIEVPNTINIILYVRWIDSNDKVQTSKVLIFGSDFVPFLSGLDSKTNYTKGHRAPQGEEMCVGVNRFHP